MAVHVTVPPICTITVGEGPSDESLAVQCRNLTDGQPAPLVLNDVSGPLEVRADAAATATIVIHF